MTPGTHFSAGGGGRWTAPGHGTRTGSVIASPGEPRDRRGGTGGHAGWDRRQYGAGILDADALLAAGLPANAPDDLPAAPLFDSLRRLTAAFPELSRATTVASLASRFAVEERALPDVLRRHSSELVYLLGENVDLSGVLCAPTPGPILTARNGHPATPLMSRHLAAALAGHQ